MKDKKKRLYKKIFNCLWACIFTDENHSCLDISVSLQDDLNKRCVIIISIKYKITIWNEKEYYWSITIVVKIN